MRFRRHNRGANRGFFGLVLAASLAASIVLLAGCGGGRPAGPPTASTAGGGSGRVSVLYAGSLVNLMEHDLGPAFSSATGYTFDGQGAGSSGLANQIKGKVKQGDVFISASPSVNDTLRGPANGDWVSWYAAFATAPLVLGYNPNSRFAVDLRSSPWRQAITEPGFRLGRTDPSTDPKGELSARALRQVGLASLADGTDGVFAETELVGRLQAGQLDAGFFYRNEAVEAHIPTVPIDPVRLGATYTVTVLNRGPHRGGALAFVDYLLGQPGEAILRRHGLDVLTPPGVTGDRTKVAPPLKRALGR
jgi:molybdate/tungstate transport system substrate-binding protein